MMNMLFKGAITATLLVASALVHSTLSVTDLAGRTVTLERPAQRVILGEGRFISLFSVLQIENPMQRIVGMMADLKRFDPASYAAYRKAFPEIEQIDLFGNTSEDSVSLEKILLLKPDLAIFGLAGHGPGAKSTHIVQRLEKAGIPIVFIDFRQSPIKNTAHSVEIVGTLLGKQSRAKAFAELYQSQLQLIAERVKGLTTEQYPTVLFDLRASADQACCLSVAQGLFAEMAQFTGGKSLASGLLPGPVGQLSYEHILSTQFDVYIGTAIGSGLQSPEQSPFLLSGPNVTPELARRSLSLFLKARKFEKLPAIKAGRAYSLWHHFYNSAFNLYAIESMAKWFHPTLFADLQPQKTLDELLSGAAPADLSGAYSISVEQTR